MSLKQLQQSLKAIDDAGKEQDTKKSIQKSLRDAEKPQAILKATQQITDFVFKQHQKAQKLKAYSKSKEITENMGKIVDGLNEMDYADATEKLQNGILEKEADKIDSVLKGMSDEDRIRIKDKLTAAANQFKIKSLANLAAISLNKRKQHDEMTYNGIVNDVRKKGDNPELQQQFMQAQIDLQEQFGDINPKYVKAQIKKLQVGYYSSLIDHYLNGDGESAYKAGFYLDQYKKILPPEKYKSLHNKLMKNIDDDVYYKKAKKQWNVAYKNGDIEHMLVIAQKTRNPFLIQSFNKMVAADKSNRLNKNISNGFSAAQMDEFTKNIPDPEKKAYLTNLITKVNRDKVKNPVKWLKDKDRENTYNISGKFFSEQELDTITQFMITNPGKHPWQVIEELEKKLNLNFGGKQNHPFMLAEISSYIKDKGDLDYKTRGYLNAAGMGFNPYTKGFSPQQAVEAVNITGGITKSLSTKMENQWAQGARLFYGDGTIESLKNISYAEAIIELREDRDGFKTGGGGVIYNKVLENLAIENFKRNAKKLDKNNVELPTWFNLNNVLNRRGLYGRNLRVASAYGEAGVKNFTNYANNIMSDPRKMREQLNGINLDQDSMFAVNNGHGEFRAVIEKGVMSIVFQHDNGNITQLRTETGQPIAAAESKFYTQKDNHFKYLKGVGKPFTKNAMLFDKASFGAQTLAKRIDKNNVKQHVEKALNKYIPKEEHKMFRATMLTMMAIESGFRNKAKSKVGAAGIAQFMPSTGQHYGVTNFEDSSQSIDAMARYLRDLYKRSRRSTNKAAGVKFTNRDVINSMVRAYNGGNDFFSSDTYIRSYEGKQSTGSVENNEYARKFFSIYQSNSLVQDIPDPSLSDEDVIKTQMHINDIRQVLKIYNIDIEDMRLWLKKTAE